jgi:chromosome segregation ATPase
MARTGIQFSDVENAALELQGSGKIPTIDGIRDILGTGSKSTISKYLRTWRAKQTEIEGTLPHELAALVTGLWKKLHTGADQRIDDIKAEHQQQVQKLNQTCTEIQQTQSELKKQLHHSEEVAATERSTKELLEKQLQQKQLEETKSQEQSQSLAKQLAASQGENARLHQLTKNTQANLEHYQQEMHQHQLKQSMQTEKQLAFYTQEISTLKQQLDTQYNQFKPLERDNEQLSATLTQLENQNQCLQSKFEATQQKLQHTHDQNNTLLERNKAINETLGSTQSQLDMITKQRNQLETKIAVFSDQNKRLQKELSQAQVKIEALRQEKLFLVQEKAQLEGFIEKMKLNI